MWTNSEYIAGAGEFGIKRGKKKKKNISFSFIWFHRICWFLFYLNTAWRRIAADIKVKVKHARRLQAI